MEKVNIMESIRMIEKHVTSLELSKKLKELEIKQESFFYWLKSANPQSKYYLSMKVGFNETYHSERISAFIASELLEIIPCYIDIKKYEPFNHFRLNIEKSIIYEKEMITNYIVSYICETFQFGDPAWSRRLAHTRDENISNSLAKMIIFLKENNLWDG